MRRIKQTGLTAYLDNIGILATGSKEEIEQARKQYWLQKRREYKRKRYQNQKSFTIFFDNAEVKAISKNIKKNDGGITGFIKEAALSSAINKPAADKKLIGKIHEALTLHYFLIKEVCLNNGLNQKIINEFLVRTEALETRLLGFFNNKSE